MSVIDCSSKVRIKQHTIKEEFTGLCYFMVCAPGMRIWYLRYQIIPEGASRMRASPSQASW